MVRKSTETGQASGSVENALRTLQLLRDRHVIRAGEVAAEIGVARSTAYRLLALLSSYGVVEQEPNSPNYRAGPLLAQLGLTKLQQHDLVTTVHPRLVALSDEVNETVHLMILDRASSVFLDSVESRRQSLRVSARTGVAYPAYSTSGGKALLACLEDDEVRGMFPTGVVPATAGRPARSIDDLLRELSEVRDNGYSTAWGENEAGLAAVAVILRTSRGAVAGAVCISAPEQRLPAPRLGSLVRTLNEVVAEISPLLP